MLIPQSSDLETKFHLAAARVTHSVKEFEDVHFGRGADGTMYCRRCAEVAESVAVTSDGITVQTWACRACMPTHPGFATKCEEHQVYV